MKKSRSSPLQRLTVVFLDLQTSAARPEKGSIIEIGWSVSGEDQISAFLIQPKRDDIVPERICRMTGIDPHLLENADKISVIYGKFTAVTRKVAKINGLENCPIVIHYAKFEEPFMRQIHRAIHGNVKFPYNIICTHEICRRIMPTLPRRGMRAITGFFGFDIPEQRRCYDHVKATALIWHELVTILRNEHAVTTLTDLRKWLDSDRPRIKNERTYPINIKHYKFPDRPGVYRMHRSTGSILYVGKATSLRNRVNSYFRKKPKHAGHILEMLTQVKKITYTETGSVLEAALRESDEIKKHRPPYNIALREHDRRVWFVDRNLAEFTNSFSRARSIGPFDSPKTVKILGSISRIVENSKLIAKRDLITESFGLPDQYAPEIGIIEKGMRHFLKKNRRSLRPPSRQSLAELARRIWIRQDDGLEENNGDRDQNENDELDWTPEIISNLLESHISRGFHALRKARWLTWLTESTIVWREKTNKKIKRFVLVIEKGVLKKHRTLQYDRRIPFPPGRKKKFSQRQKNFDLMAFDRMRIVATEIRKMLNNDQFVNVVLRDKILDEGILKKIYKWI